MMGLWFQRSEPIDSTGSD